MYCTPKFILSAVVLPIVLLSIVILPEALEFLITFTSLAHTAVIPERSIEPTLLYVTFVVPVAVLLIAENPFVIPKVDAIAIL